MRQWQEIQEVLRQARTSWLIFKTRRSRLTVTRLGAGKMSVPYQRIGSEYVALTVVVQAGCNIWKAAASCDGRAMVHSRIMADIMPNAKPVMIPWKPQALVERHPKTTEILRHEISLT